MKLSGSFSIKSAVTLPVSSFLDREKPSLKALDAHLKDFFPSKRTLKKIKQGKVLKIQEQSLLKKSLSTHLKELSQKFDEMTEKMAPLFLEGQGSIPYEKADLAFQIYQSLLTYFFKTQELISLGQKAKLDSQDFYQLELTWIDLQYKIDRVGLTIAQSPCLLKLSSALPLNAFEALLFKLFQLKEMLQDTLNRYEAFEILEKTPSNLDLDDQGEGEGEGEGFDLSELEKRIQETIEICKEPDEEGLLDEIHDGELFKRALKHFEEKRDLAEEERLDLEKKIFSLNQKYELLKKEFSTIASDIEQQVEQLFDKKEPLTSMIDRQFAKHVFQKETLSQSKCEEENRNFLFFKERVQNYALEIKNKRDFFLDQLEDSGFILEELQQKMRLGKER